MTEQKTLTTSPLPVRLRVEDYLLLDRSGAFEGYGKTELIGGEVFYMNAQHRPHARVKSRLYGLLAEALADSGLEALIEASVEIPPHNAPEPDIVITSEPDGEGLIPLASVRLVIEVSDSTLANDLGRKAQLYAAQAIPEYWVFDLQGRAIHQFWKPLDNIFSEHHVITFGKPITAITIEELVIATAAL
jgi:Uma2 family endonuclease